MAITRSQALVLLEPKLEQIWHNAYPIYEAEYVGFVNSRESKKATITDYRMTDFGTLRLKGEGEATQSDDPIFGGTKTYQPVRFALKYSVTREMLDHELYGQVERLETGLMTSAIHQQETVAINLLNGGFGTTDADGYGSTGFDGLGLFSTAHTRLDGGTSQANRPTTGTDLGVSSLQTGLTQFHNFVDDRGRPIMVKPRKLIISPEEEFTAEELLGSEYKPDTANNAINALRKYGLSLQISHYKNDTDAWFLIGDKHDLNFLWYHRPESTMWEDEDAECVFRKVAQGFVVSFGSWVGTYGNPGI